MRLFLLTLLLSACGDPPGKQPEGDCDPQTRYGDFDEDGFGDPAFSFQTCSPDRGVENAGDCDDHDATIHPGADEDCALTIDSNCDGSVGFEDADGDGTAACEDCDDTDPTMNPDAAEFCDGVDEDCDGAVDDDPSDGFYWYPDTDADGYGAETDSMRACVQPDGYMLDPLDCDDTNADVHPGATEMCNGLDDNCDGGTDDDAALDRTTWYVDTDGDGYGRDDYSTDACDAPAGRIAIGGDCEDRDDTINPGATEVCNGVDDDCDGGTDDSEATDALAWYEDADLDGHGVSTGFVYACEVPVGGSAVDDDCDDADATVYAGADETCDGVDDDCDGTVDEDSVDAPGWYTDADGDGYGDESTEVLDCSAPAGLIADGTDCDDTRATVSPGASELCNSRDDDCDGVTDENTATDAPTWYDDDDSDGYGDPADTRVACSAPAGYVASNADCDDRSAATSPAATEVCDGDDDDCDGTVDEDDAADATTWYADADADGYGNAGAAHAACSMPSGYVATGTDCDDGSVAFHPGAAETDCSGTDDYNCDGFVGGTDHDGDGYASCEECDDGDAAVSPVATEICNEVDDDCDGVTDGAGALGGSTWYADTDADGWGNTSITAEACVAPTGYVALDEDCDDANAAVNPDAAESCATTADDDCDGDTNPADADGCTEFYFDLDGDGAGSTSHDCLCEPEGYLTASANDDCDDGDGTVYPGAAEVWGNGADDDCDDVVDVVDVSTAADATFIGETNQDFSGYALAGAGDLNADGYDDIVIGAYGADSGGSSSGSAYIVLGPVSGELDLSAADGELIGETSSDFAGYDVASAGDVDGDGQSDLLIGAPTGATGTQGLAYLLYGPVTGIVDLSAADATFTGLNNNDYAGNVVSSAGDQNDDGLDDLLIAAYKDDDGASDGGTVAIFYGAGVSSVTWSSADATLVGEDRQDYAGYSASDAGDLDGDGVVDLVIGAYGDDDGGSTAGAAYVLFGPVSGTIDLSAADIKLVGEVASDNAGYSVDGARDVDGDGQDDVIVGAFGAGTGGTAYVVYGGGATGSVDLSTADAQLEGADSSENAGVFVAGLGDLNADAYADLAVGSTGNDDAASDAGAVYLVYGPVSGTLSLDDADAAFLGSAGSDALGKPAGAGDVDGDGFADFLIGAYSADDGGTSSGTSYLFFGR